MCTVKCVHCQVCSQVPCALVAGAAKRSAPIGQCQCHGLDAVAAKDTDAVAAKAFAPKDPLPDAKAGSEPVTCFSEIVASCFPKLWGLLAGPRLVLLFITKGGRTKPRRTRRPFFWCSLAGGRPRAACRSSGESLCSQGSAARRKSWQRASNMFQ